MLGSCRWGVCRTGRWRRMVAVDWVVPRTLRVDGSWRGMLRTASLRFVIGIYWMLRSVLCSTWFGLGWSWCVGGRAISNMLSGWGTRRCGSIDCSRRLCLYSRSLSWLRCLTGSFIMSLSWFNFTMRCFCWLHFLMLSSRSRCCSSRSCCWSRCCRRITQKSRVIRCCENN